MTKLKGPVFPSFLNSGPSEKDHFEFTPHSSQREQLKNLRLKCKDIIDSTDPEVVVVGRRVIQATIDEPVPEFGALHLMSAGLDASAEDGVTWIEAMTSILDQFGVDETLFGPPQKGQQHASVNPRRRSTR